MKHGFIGREKATNDRGKEVTYGTDHLGWDTCECVCMYVSRWLVKICCSREDLFEEYSTLSIGRHWLLWLPWVALAGFVDELEAWSGYAYFALSPRICTGFGLST